MKKLFKTATVIVLTVCTNLHLLHAQDAIHVAPSGNVGIGTSTPNAPLQFGNSLLKRKIVLWEVKNNGNQFYGFGLSSSTLRYQVGDPLANHIFYAATGKDSSKELMRITGNGNVGIGTTDPKTALEVNGTVKAKKFDGNEALVKGTLEVNGTVRAKKFDGSEALVNGTVKANSLILGVNRTNPLYPLDVHGIINTDSVIYIKGTEVLSMDNRTLIVGARYRPYTGFTLSVGTGNTLIGYGAGTTLNTVLLNNTAIGTLAETQKCSEAVALGYSSHANYDNSIAIGAYAAASDANTIRLGNTRITKIETAVSITFPSDRNKKEKIYLVNKQDLLNKLIKIPLSSWNFKGQDPEKFRHYGPMAQDFYAAFGKDKYGTIGSDTTINSQDIEGINMIAIQALADRVLKLTDENANLKKQLNKLAGIESENALLKTSVSQLKLSVIKQEDLLNKLLDKLDLVALKKVSGKSVAVK
jgi:hypothetical protein